MSMPHKCSCAICRRPLEHEFNPAVAYLESRATTAERQLAEAVRERDALRAESTNFAQRLAHEKLRADQFEQRWRSKTDECNQLRAAL